MESNWVWKANAQGGEKFSVPRQNSDLARQHLFSLYLRESAESAGNKTDSHANAE
jgi:hypothetical protein